MRKMIAMIRVRWMKMEIERCEQTAEEINGRKRDLLHFQIKNAHLLPESMRYTFRRMT